MMVVLVGIIVLRGGAGVLGRSTATSTASCRCRPGSSSAISNFVVGEPLDSSWRRRRRRSSRRGRLGPAAGAAGTARPGCCCGCRGSGRPPGSSPRRRWRGRWRRCSAAASRSSTRSRSRRGRMSNRYLASELDGVRRRVQEGQSFAAALRGARRLPRRGREDGGSRRVDRRAAGDAEQPRRLLRRGDRDRGRAVHHADRAGCCWSSWASSSPPSCWRSTCRSSS